MPIYRLNTKIRLTMLFLGGFELYSRWVPLKRVSCEAEHFYERATEQGQTREERRKNQTGHVILPLFFNKFVSNHRNLSLFEHNTMSSIST